jgi:hypothetical protein
MVVVQTARGTVERQHARGLTIQLSQGHGRQPSGPRGRLRPRVCCARKLLLPSMVVRRRQDNTPERCVSTEKLFLFCCVLSVPSLDLSLQILALLIVSIPTWLWQPTITHREGTVILVP